MNTKNFISVIRNTCYFVITKGKIWCTFLLTARAIPVPQGDDRKEGQLVLTLLMA